MAVAVSIKILVIFKNFALSLKIIKIRIALKYIKLKIEVFPGLKLSYYSQPKEQQKSQNRFGFLVIVVPFFHHKVKIANFA